MNLLPFEGYMIPGLHFKNCSIWILNWEDNPTPYKKMIEVWILWYDGKKECYITPIEAETVLRKYHSFDRVISSKIDLTENSLGCNLKITVNEKETCLLNLKYKQTLKYRIINLILKLRNKNRTGEKGITETGKHYHNMPKRIVPLHIESAELNGVKLEKINTPDFKFSLGDGKPSDEPLVNFCIHMLEE